MPGSLSARSWDWSGCVMTLGSYDSSVGPNLGSLTICLWILAGPVVSQRTPWPIPELKLETPQLKSIGSPEKNDVMPLTSQPPNALLARRVDEFLKNGRSYT